MKEARRRCVSAPWPFLVVRAAVPDDWEVVMAIPGVQMDGSGLAPAEDPASAAFRKRTQDLLAQPDEELENMIPLLGRRVDYVQRRYNRDSERRLCHRELL